MYLTRSARVWSIIAVGVICFALFELVVPGSRAAMFGGDDSGWITGAVGLLLILGGGVAAYIGYRIDLREAQRRDLED